MVDYLMTRQPDFVTGDRRVYILTDEDIKACSALGSVSYAVAIDGAGRAEELGIRYTALLRGDVR